MARHDGKIAQAQTEALFASLMRAGDGDGDGGGDGGGNGSGARAARPRRRDVHQVARDRAFR